MKFLDFDIYTLAFIKYLIYGLLIFLSFFLLNKVAASLPFRRKYKDFTVRTLSIVEGLTWFLFIVYASQQLISDPTLNSIILLAICLVAIIWLAWFGVRDFIAGIILKSDGSLSRFERINVKGITGKILSLGYRSLELETDNGETVTIPYSRISGEMRIKPNPSKTVKSHRFELSLPKDMPVSETRDLLNTLVNSAPWSSLKKEPQLKILAETEDLYRFEIIIYTLQVEYFQKVKQYIHAHLPKVKFSNATVV
ncbi:mechanosensitive ion channel domain-containing protein [Rapidithrix thailandica]|uniref:Mechanosensitive ion channel domain-containing protein n=1 Tax=Rapidithrix thailandica TaxID=413964 RepID=A0AAW9RSA1_9BACT